MDFSEEEINNFPSYEEYLLKLKEFGQEDLSNLSYREIEDKYYNLCIVLPTISMMTNSEKFNNINLFRARLQKTIGDKEDIGLIQAHSYPPTSIVNNNGRANIKNRSVFYCSDHYIASILECNPDVGDIGYLGLWKPVTKRDMKFLLYISDDLNEQNIFFKIGKNAFQYYKEKKINDPLGKQLVALRKFIADKFISEVYPYSITSFIANESLYREFNADYIIYPSLKSFTYYNNYAFHPNSVNENLQLKKVLKFKILEKQQDRVVIGHMAVGTFENVCIKWVVPNHENVKDFKFDNNKFYSEY